MYYVNSISPGYFSMTETYTAFIGTARVAQGPVEPLTAALIAFGHGPHPSGLLVFNDRTGAETDLNLSGRAPDDRPPQGFRPDGTARRGPGRPRLGVKAREVILLPRHWDWLAKERGGASATLRRLVEAAMRDADANTAPGPDAAFSFLTAIAGDLPGYEAAIRALYADGGAGFAGAIAGWPEDIRAYALRLAGPSLTGCTG